MEVKVEVEKKHLDGGKRDKCEIPGSESIWFTHMTPCCPPPPPPPSVFFFRMCNIGANRDFTCVRVSVRVSICVCVCVSCFLGTGSLVNPSYHVHCRGAKRHAFDGVSVEIFTELCISS